MLDLAGIEKVIAANGMIDEDVLVKILHFAKSSNYKFTTVTPKTHQTVLNRRPTFSTDLRDIFGWNTRFSLETISPELRSIISHPSFLLMYKKEIKSPVRIATFEQDLFLHSSYPTCKSDSVFFGPDTYRFLRFIKHALQNHPSMNAAGRRKQPCRVLDVGCGSGAGGLIAARTLGHCNVNLVMNDINPTAIAYTKINADFAGIPVTTALGDAFTAVTGNFDVIISNPPFLCDNSERAYRHGGDKLGRALSVRLAKEALSRLNPGGKLIMYTGVVMLDDRDPFLMDIEPLLKENAYEWTYEEIDPDIFSEELDRSVYFKAERIAAVGLTVTASK